MPHDDDIVANAPRERLTPLPLLAAVGVLAFGGGVLLMRATLVEGARPETGPARAEASPPTEAQAGSAAPSAAGRSTAATTTARAPSAAPQASTPARTSPATPPAPAPVAAAPAAPALPNETAAHAAAVAQKGRRALQGTPGRVAYLRCEGLERPAATPPCPRDEAFEAAVWQSVEALRTCTSEAPPFGAAEFDLRVEVRGTERTVYAKGGGDHDALTRDWLACVEPAVKAAPLALASPRLVVSFRFTLRE